jgi:hypothetical protein
VRPIGAAATPRRPLRTGHPDLHIVRVMFHRPAMITKRLDTIDGYARQRLDLRVTCLPCGHEVVLNSVALSLLRHEQRRSRRIDRIEDDLVCSNCGQREVFCRPVFRDD